jgi:hypothetical protein
MAHNVYLRYGSERILVMNRTHIYCRFYNTYIFVLIRIFLVWYEYLRCSQHLYNYHFVINGAP